MEEAFKQNQVKDSQNTNAQDTDYKAKGPAPSLSALVIGMGLFGSSVARKLTQAGWFVLAVDDDQNKLNSIANEVSSVRVINAVDLKVIQSLEPHTFDICVSAIGDENAHVISTTIHNLKSCNAPFIVARILNKQHEAIYRKLGCDLVVEPEKYFGEELSNILHNHLMSGHHPSDLSTDFRITAEQLKEAQLSTNKAQKDEVAYELKQDLSQYLLIVLELLIWGFIIQNIYQLQNKVDLLNEQLSHAHKNSESLDSQMQVLFILMILWLVFKSMRSLLGKQQAKTAR